MACKYVVTDVTNNQDYVFHDLVKINDNDRTVKLLRDGLKEAKEKYNELLSNEKKLKLILTKVYPDYKNGTLITDLILSNI